MISRRLRVQEPTPYLLLQTKIKAARTETAPAGAGKTSGAITLPRPIDPPSSRVRTGDRRAALQVSRAHDDTTPPRPRKTTKAPLLFRHPREGDKRDKNVPEQHRDQRDKTTIEELVEVQLMELEVHFRGESPDHILIPHTDPEVAQRESHSDPKAKVHDRGSAPEKNRSPERQEGIDGFDETHFAGADARANDVLLIFGTGNCKEGRGAVLDVFEPAVEFFVGVSHGSERQPAMFLIHLCHDLTHASAATDKK